MQYSFNVCLGDKDYFEFNKFHVRNTPQGKRSSRITYICLAVLFVVASLFTFLNNGYNAYSLIFICSWLVAVILIALLLDPLITSLMLRLSIAIMRKSGKMPYEKESVIEFYGDHFVEIATTSRNEVKYEGIERVMISAERTVYIYVNNTMAYILPSSTFASVTEREEFIEFINKKAKKTKNK